MDTARGRDLLVGDNPFHGISHLSQDRARVRTGNLTLPEYAAELVIASVHNGANGFMFSVSDTTLSILSELRERGATEDLTLYAIVPYAYEYVRAANQVGGLPGLVRKFTKEIVQHRNIHSMTAGVKGILGGNVIPLLEAYLDYEIHRVKRSIGEKGKLGSIMIHEVLTDLALALELKHVFKSHVAFLRKRNVVPGFNTCNFALLVSKFKEWNIDLSALRIAAPFNQVGFQMNPSRADCETELAGLKDPILIAISILAAGYLTPKQAIGYIAGLPNLKGVAVGVSQERHAQETFRLLRDAM